MLPAIFSFFPLRKGDLTNFSNYPVPYGMYGTGNVSDRIHMLTLQLHNLLQNCKDCTFH